MSEGSSVPPGQIPATLVQRETFARGGLDGDRLRTGDAVSPAGPAIGASARAPQQWWMLARRGAFGVPTLQSDDLATAAVAPPALSAVRAGLAQQAQLLVSMMAAFDKGGDAGADERQTIQPVHRPEPHWVSPAIM